MSQKRHVTFDHNFRKRKPIWYRFVDVRTLPSHTYRQETGLPVDRCTFAVNCILLQLVQWTTMTRDRIAFTTANRRRRRIICVPGANIYTRRQYVATGMQRNKAETCIQL